MAAITGGELSGGFRKYLNHITPLLRSDPRVTELRLLVPEGAVDTLDPRLEANSWRSIAGGDGLATQVAKLRPDVVFIPTARWLGGQRAPVVTMVRNMEPFVCPVGGNSAKEVAKNVARLRQARACCCRSRRIIAVSEYVKSILVDRWAISPVSVGVVHHGVDVVSESNAFIRPKSVRLERRFAFMAGSIRPARGLEDVLNAFAMAPRDSSRPALVIAGGTTGSRRYRQRLGRAIAELGLGEDVTWAGELRSAEMAWCFEHCDIFVISSRAEACPNTALEALAHGCVSLSTDQPPMPEIFGSSAIYYRRGEPAHLSEMLREAFSLNEISRLALARSARLRAAGFRWDVTATRTVDELALALS